VKEKQFDEDEIHKALCSNSELYSAMKRAERQLRDDAIAVAIRKFSDELTNVIASA
jgi:hypothetical protein